MIQNKPTSIRLPPDVEAEMKRLAAYHDRSINKEVVQACKAWIQAERKTTMASEIYTFKAILGKGQFEVEKMVSVEGQSEERAREVAVAFLEENGYDDEHGYVLAELNRYTDETLP